MKRASGGWALAVATAVVAGGCFYDVDGKARVIEDAGESDTGGGGDAGDETGNVSGTVTIGEGLNADSYAVGDLYLSFLAACPSGVEEVEVYGLFVVEGLDFSTAGATRVFALNDVPAGTSFLWGFLDSDGNVADPEAPEPGLPDAIATSCYEIDLAAGATITDAELTLDMTMPY